MRAPLRLLGLMFLAGTLAASTRRPRARLRTTTVPTRPELVRCLRRSRARRSAPPTTRGTRAPTAAARTTRSGTRPQAAPGGAARAPLPGVRRARCDRRRLPHGPLVRLIPVTCTATDQTGRGALSFPNAGESYLVLVGRERDSDDGKFRFTLFRQEADLEAARPAPAGPRRQLVGRPDHGLRRRRGRSRCARRRVPDEPLAGARPAASRFRLFRPGHALVRDRGPGSCRSVRRLLRLHAGARRRRPLHAARDGDRPAARPAALPPPGRASPGATTWLAGLPLRNLQTRTRHRSRRTRIDVVDLYRFRVAGRADAVASTPARPARPRARLLLLGENGRRARRPRTGPDALTATSRPRHATTSPSEATESVSARALSALPARARDSTTTTILANGSRSAIVSPGSSVAIDRGRRTSARKDEVRL